MEKDTFDGNGKLKMFEGEIVTVMSVEMYSSCRNCNAKVESSEGIVVCGKRNSKMKILKCAKKVLHMLLWRTLQNKNTNSLYLVKS